MKKTLFALLLFFSVFFSLAQEIKGGMLIYESNLNKNDFIELSRPNPNNWLSNYLREKISNEELEELKQVHILKNKSKANQTYIDSIITLSFKVDTYQNISDVSFNSGLEGLDKKVRRIFKKIPLAKLKIQRPYLSRTIVTKVIHTVQLFELKKNKLIFNASTYPISKDKNYKKRINLKKKTKKPLAVTYLDLEKEFSPDDIGKIDLSKGYYSFLFYDSINARKKRILETKKLYKDSTRVSENSWLSNFLNRKLSKKDIESLKYVRHFVRKPISYIANDSLFIELGTYKLNKLTHLNIVKNNTIIANFIIDTNNQISGIYIKTGIKYLDRKLRALLKQIPLKNLGLTEENSSGLYTVQLFEYKNDIAFINASENALKRAENNRLLVKENYQKNSEKEKLLYKKLSKPDPESWLSKFINKKINSKDLQDLKNIQYQSYSSYYLYTKKVKKENDSIKTLTEEELAEKTSANYAVYDKNNIIPLSFKVNTKNDIYGVSINTGVKYLDSKIRTAFKKYASIKKLGISNKNNKGKYSIQIFEYKNNTPFVSASTKAIKEKSPILKKCKNTKRKQSCFKKELTNHILNNISLETISRQDLRGQINYTLSFTINSLGKITQVKSMAPNEIIRKEIDRVINTFSAEIIPAKKNNLPVEYLYTTKSQFAIDEN